MTSPRAHIDTGVLLILQNIKEGLETGRISTLNTVQTEVEAAIAECDRPQLLEGSTDNREPVGKLSLEIESLREKITKCESQLVEFQSLAEVLKEETSQIVTRTEACNLLVQQQQKENAKVRAEMEGMKAGVSTMPPPRHVPMPSPTDPVLRSAPSRTAVVFFTDRPRTVTIHPLDSSNYQPIIRDENGDVVITIRGTKPLHREGAFISLEELESRKPSCVYGRVPESGSQAVPPHPRWPDWSEPSSYLPPYSPGDIIARQRQLLTNMQTDAFGRVLPPDYLVHAKSPSLPTGMSSEPPQDAASASSVNPEIIATPASTPTFLTVRRGKKRARHTEEVDDVSPTAEIHGGACLQIDVRSIEEPVTPTPIKCEESRPLEGPAKRKKLRSSASEEALTNGSLSRSNSVHDLTRTV